MKNKSAEILLNEIGEFQRNIQRIEADTEKTIKEIRNQRKKAIDVEKRKIKGRTLKLFIIFITRKDKSKKTMNFVNGQIRSFFTPPAVRISSIKNVLKNLKLKGLSRFIRTIAIEEVDKEAISMDFEAVKDVKGISLVQKERFEIIPKETNEGVLEDVKKLQKEAENVEKNV